jgi:hypothetical protein
MGSSAVCQSLAMKHRLSSPYVTPPHGTCHTASSAACSDSNGNNSDEELQLETRTLARLRVARLVRVVQRTLHSSAHRNMISPRSPP